MKIIAHRGIYDKKIGENTYLAITNAINNKFITGIEFDIRLTKDNKIVVIHDKTINRTSNGFGIVENMTLKELQKYNFGKKQFYQTIPTLEKILSIKNNKILLIEIKINKNVNKFYKVLTDTIKKFPYQNIYLMSFNKTIIKKLKKKCNSAKVGFIYLTNNINKYYKNDFCVLNHIFIDKKKLDILIKEKKEIFLWTVNNFNDFQNLKKQINYSNIYCICNIAKTFSKGFY